MDGDSLKRIRDLLDGIEEDFRKAKGGNRAAGTRVRKVMQDIKSAAQEIRQEMLESRESASDASHTSSSDFVRVS